MRQSSPGGDDAFTGLEQAFGRVEDVDCDPPTPEPSRRRAALLAVLFAIAVVILAAVIAYVAAAYSVNRAAAHTDQRVAVLESDLQQRREAAAVQNADRDQQIAELHRLVCLFADHSQPRDGDVEEARARYNCSTTSPSPSPSPSPART